MLLLAQVLGMLLLPFVVIPPAVRGILCLTEEVPCERARRVERADARRVRALVRALPRARVVSPGTRSSRSSPRR